MKLSLSRILSVFVAVMAALAFSIPEADARRLGGGKSIGQQSGNVTQRSAAPQQPAAAPQAPARPAAAPAATGGNRWLGPIAGLAAGLGLAALASYLGFGEELASFMLIALLVFAAVVVFRMLASRRTPGGPQPAYQGGYSPANLGQEATVRYSPLPQAAVDARAPVPSVGPAAASGGSWGVPAELDVEAFVRTAKVQFVRLQAVFDAADLDDLREFTTPEMYAELKLEIDERKGALNRTDVVTLDAELLGIETSSVEHIASVRFTGMIREEASREAKPFDEVWNLVKPVAGGGWVLAGIQQLG
ncbi:MAG TPA: Tim44-like domain-containing protein [Burkholderiaceae bacterium]|jgi:predicted lipid-binding transport protein (Tim44 family)|nr:Tim44-like domain-containing protein [Burkholderiaceae bacterium]HRA77939.1 Tim44-like domain-containing protein [Burkholderiaceae bacterium]